MQRTPLILALGALLALSPVQSQARDDVEQLVNDVQKSEDKNYLTLTIENDKFGGDSDQNYTSGVRLGWFNPLTKPPETVQRALPFININETTSTTYSIGQNLFTPEAVESREQDPNDRPWAAFLYGSLGIVTLTNDYLDEYELTLGVVGPAALGEEAQKTVHKIVKSTNPNGWDNQLKNEPGLMLSWQRRWPGLLHQRIGPLDTSFTPHAGATLGNIYTYANAGGSFTFSPDNAKWTEKPLMVRPAAPGTGFFKPATPISWKLFTGFEGRAVARNIFLDGNTFTDSHSVDKKPLVLDLTAGAGLILGHTEVNYTLVYRTKEFDTQTNESIYGGISIGYNF